MHYLSSDSMHSGISAFLRISTQKCTREEEREGNNVVTLKQRNPLFEENIAVDSGHSPMVRHRIGLEIQNKLNNMIRTITLSLSME